MFSYCRNLFGFRIFLFAVLFLTMSSWSMPAWSNEEGQKLNRLISEFTESLKSLDTYDAPYYDVKEDFDKFGDYLSEDYFAREKRITLQTKEKLDKIKPNGLLENDRITYDLFLEDLSVAVSKYDFDYQFLGFNQMGNRLLTVIDDSNPDLTSFPFTNLTNYEAYLLRMKGFPAFIDRQIQMLKKLSANKLTLNCEVAKKVRSTYQSALEKNIDKNPFLRPALRFPSEINISDQTRLLGEFKNLISQDLIPAFEKFDRYYVNEYIPNCRKSFGLSDLPNAKKWYQYQIWSNTNLHMKPKEIHEVGLSEVARIRSEFEQVKKALGFKGSLKEFFQSLNKDEKYYFKSSQELKAAFYQVKDLIEAKIPKYFDLIPQTPYEIVESSNPEDAAASYRVPTESVPRGRFVINALNLKATPKFGVTTLSMHEAVPGHHFQLALVYEMKDSLSEYRRKIFNSNSFVEGWALYAERLGYEMGLYEDPLQKLGNLNDEMLRAVRLVVDTGIHAYGWSRKKAQDYMKANLASVDKDIEIEVDRYSVWPGQALGYKLGQLKIMELRRLAEKKMGNQFDIRKFHSEVIGRGTISLGVLEARIEDWIQRQGKDLGLTNQL